MSSLEPGDIRSSNAKREATLFLGTHEEFAFDFGGSPSAVATAEDEGILGDKEGGRNEDDDDNEARENLLAPSPAMVVPTLNGEQVSTLFYANLAMGSAFFSIPRKIDTVEEVIAQHRHVFLRQLQQLKEKHFALQRKEDALRRKRERDL